MLEFLFKGRFITEFLKEDCYNSVAACVVVTDESAYDVIYVTYADGDDIEDVYKKHITSCKTEKEAIALAEDYFNKNIR